MRRWSNSSMQLREEFLLPSLTLCQIWWSSDPSRSHLTSLIWPCYWVKAAHRRVWQIPELVLRDRCDWEQRREGTSTWQGSSGERDLSLSLSASCFAACQAAGVGFWELGSISRPLLYHQFIKTLLTMSYRACNINTGTPAFQVLQEIATIVRARTSQDKNKC